jgi:hypothetical protein
MDYLQQDLENDEYFYKNVVSTFIERVSDMNELMRKTRSTFQEKNKIDKSWLAHKDRYPSGTNCYL